MTVTISPLPPEKKPAPFVVFLPLGFFIFYLAVVYIPRIIMGEPSGGQPIGAAMRQYMLGLASVIAFGNLVFYFVYFLVKKIYITPRLRPLVFSYIALFLFGFLSHLWVWTKDPHQINVALFVPGIKFAEMAFDIIHPEIRKEREEMQRKFIEGQYTREQEALAIKRNYKPPCDKSFREMMEGDYQARGHDMLLQVDEKNRIYLQVALEYRPRWQINEIIFLRFEENGLMNEEFQLHLNCLLPGFITENGIRESLYLGDVFAAPASDDDSILFLVNKGELTQDQKVQQLLYYPERQEPELKITEPTGLKTTLFAFGTGGSIFYVSNREFDRARSVRSDPESGRPISVKLDPLVIGRIDLEDKTTVSSVIYDLNSKNELNSQDRFAVESFHVMPHGDIVTIIETESILEQPRYHHYYLRLTAAGVEKEFRILSFKNREGSPFYPSGKMTPLDGGKILVYDYNGVYLFDGDGNEAPEFGENAKRWISSTVAGGGIASVKEDLKGRIIIAGKGKDGKPVMMAFLPSGYRDASFLTTIF